MIFFVLHFFSCGGVFCSKSDRFGDERDQNCDGIDGIDGDGDGIASWQSGGEDCDDSDPNKREGQWLYLDFDLDGFGDPDIKQFFCKADQPFGWVENHTDCDDQAASSHPEHVEICDFLDNDCDGLIDSDDDILDDMELVALYLDADQDGYGDREHKRFLCFGTANFVLNNMDCDDSSIEIAPNQRDIEGDGIDQNCDGSDVFVESCSGDFCVYSLREGDMVQDFVSIPAGVFVMGSPENENGRDGDETQHIVELSRDVLMMNTEMTQEWFEMLMGYNPAWLAHPAHPIETVSWFEAAQCANALTDWSNEHVGTNWDRCYVCTEDFCVSEGFAYDCSGYRLPTEAEWEYAARAGTQKALWTPNGGGNIPTGMENAFGCENSWSLSDGTNIEDVAWFCLNSTGTEEGHHPVGQKQANSFGLYDMNGNVWEWTEDDYGSSFQDAIDPMYVDEGVSKVIKGGRWAFWARSLRSAERGTYAPDNQRNELGFRLVRSSSSNTR